ncbi:MAG: APC family permease, partial [Ktedonobacterales bacterium]
MSDVLSSLPPAAPPTTGATTSRAAGSLKSGHLGLWHAIVISVAVMSPASSIFFNTIPQAQQAGAAIPLCYVIGFVVALLVANQYSELSRELPSAGSAFTYVIEGLGPRWGFLTGWIGLIAVALGAPFTFVIMSANLQAIVYRWSGINLHWSFYFVAATGLVFALCYIGVRESLRIDLAFLTFEILICLLLAAIVLLRVGQQGGLTLAPFTASPVPANGSLAIGVVFAVLSFIGFEMAATLAEETADPRRNIPRAVFGAMIVVGVFYIVMAYAATIGYGPNKMVTGYGNDPAPFDTIARHFGGPVFAAIIDVVGIF